MLLYAMCPYGGLYHMGETEALFREQEALGPQCFGPETKTIVFFTITLKCLLHTYISRRHLSYVSKFIVL